jgi:hypothetical protein
MVPNTILVTAKRTLGKRATKSQVFIEGIKNSFFCNYQRTLARILEIIIKKAPRVKLRNEAK